MIVNVASKCGMTPQYAGLQEIYDQFKDKGFVIVGFPCNQFASQEPGTDEEIATFCTLNYGVTFPIMKKVNVNGNETNPVYKFLKSQKSSFGLGVIKWNFEKFLINRKGEVVNRYTSVTKPESIKEEIERLLSEPEA